VGTDVEPARAATRCTPGTMIDDDIWQSERAFWLAGEAHHAQALDPACLMVFPGIGALDRAAALDGLKGAPRWRDVAMEERRLARPAPDIVSLAYRARGERDGAAPYEAWCSSSYRREGDRWLLFQHQQTPA
jgi:hypothetical protein